MTGALVLSPKLKVPIDVVTETIAVLGIRGSGKTNTAVTLAEELLAHGQQVVVVDPTDVWWGLKSSADGQAPGYPVIVLGGRKAELPLGAADGPAIADVVVDHGASLILALRHFASKGDMRRFITEFAERLYYRKGQLEAPTPLMLIIDEASLVVPQNVMGENARMVGAIQQLVRQGRSSGIGVTLIDQRPASVNKDVLTQLEALICHRITSPQDRKALKEWVQQHDEHDRGGQFLDSLASLPQGTAWIWSPGLLNLFQKVPIRARRTFDSSRTPKAGETIQAPTTFAPVDLEALRGQLAQTIEENRANDPKALHARIRQLETLVDQVTVASRASATIADRDVEREVQLAIADEAKRHNRYRDVVLRGAKAALQLTGEARVQLENALGRITALEQEYTALVGGVEEEWIKPVEFRNPDLMKFPLLRPDPAPGRLPSMSARPVNTPATPALASGELTGPKLKILQACVQLEALGIPKPTLVQVALFVGVSHTTGSYQQNVRELVGDGYLMRESGRVSLIDTGRAVAGDVEIPTRRTLLDFWYAKLSGPQAKILAYLVKAYPEHRSLLQVATAVGVSPTTGSFQQNVRDLATYGLVDRSKGGAVATDLLFPRGLR